MMDIFISYAREDLATAERLAQALTPYGWSVWWDRHIPAGRRFDEVIAEQLLGASCVLVLWSRNGIHSEWVMEEAETARTNSVLVPVMIEAVQPPIGFRRIHAASLIGWSGTISHPDFKRLLIDITNIIGRQRRQHTTASLHPFPEPALEPVPPELDKSDSMRPVAWTTGASGVRGAETVEAAWDPAAVQAIETELAHFIGPVAKVVVRRAMQDAADLESLCTAVARSIPFDADRRQFLMGVNNPRQSRSLSTTNSGGYAATPTSGSARGHPGLLTGDADLGEIEQALARHIGPIAKVILKRARAMGGTRDELCEHLAAHIEGEDERRQFFAAITR